MYPARRVEARQAEAINRRVRLTVGLGRQASTAPLWSLPLALFGLKDGFLPLHMINAKTYPPAMHTVMMKITNPGARTISHAAWSMTADIAPPKNKVVVHRWRFLRISRLLEVRAAS